MRTGVAPALETKFLLFDVRQEQDSALSLPPRLALGLTRFPPARRRLFRTCVRLSVRRSGVKSRSVGGERTFRFGTCGPLFHSEPSLCGGEVPPFRSRFLAAPTRPSPKGTPRKCRSRPSCCAVTPFRVRDGVSSGVRTIPSDGDTCCGKGGRTRRLAGEFRRHDWGLSCPDTSREKRPSL